MPSNSLSLHRPTRLARSAALAAAVIAAVVSAAFVLVPDVPVASAQQALGDNEVLEQVIPRNDFNWRYNESLTDLGTTWRGLNYTYGADWKTGRARFSNDLCCNTHLNVKPYQNAVYFRKEFTIAQVDQLNEMMVSFQYDDAAILWLNGTEVYRTIRGNLPATGEVPYNYDVMTGGAEDLYVEMPGMNYVELNPSLGSNLNVWVPAIDVANLREGKNVFAIMLFNRRGSKDTSTDLALEVVREIPPVPTATPIPPTPVPPTPVPTIPPPTATPTPVVEPPSSVRTQTSCLDSRGRVDVTISNPGSRAKTYTVLVGSIERSVTVAAAGAQTVTVTGRPDGPIAVTVSESGTVFSRESVTVDCTSDIEVTSETSCLDSNGRLDFWVKNTGTNAATYTLKVAQLSPRSRAVFPGQRTRIAVTGRPDGPIAWEITRDGVPIATDTARVDCDPNDPVTISPSCMMRKGRIDVYLNNSTMRTNRYTVVFNNALSRSVDLASTTHGRITVTGRPDGDNSIMVYENETAIHAEKVTIDCSS